MPKNYLIKRERSRWEVHDLTKKELLIRTNAINWMFPQTNRSFAVTDKVKVIKTKLSNGDDMILLDYGDGSWYKKLKTQLILRKDRFEIKTNYQARLKHYLRRWIVVPNDTFLNFYDMVNFRNRQYTPQTWPELLLGGGSLPKLKGGPSWEIEWEDEWETVTDSSDLQFAPHPSLFVFRKHDAHLLVASKDLPRGCFGMYLRVNKHKVKDWYLDCGEKVNTIGEGEIVESPCLVFYLSYSNDVHKVIERYVYDLVREGLISRKSDNISSDWWFSPYYITWGDQMFLASNDKTGTEIGNLNWGGPKVKTTPQKIFNEKMVYQSLRIIKREKLPIGIIEIDDGWELSYGDWEPSSIKFPNFRKMVEVIHQQGLKSILWIAPFDAVLTSNLYKSHPEFFAPAGSTDFSKKAKNFWGNPFLDYSYPPAQNWLKELVRRLLSKSGGYNFDGLKLDCNAMKIPRYIRVYNPDWLGEETFLFKASKLFYDYVKEAKKDALVLGCTAHPYFGQCQDVVRTYDVHNSDWTQHRTRGKMIKALTSDIHLSYDFHLYREKFSEYLEACRLDKVIPELGNLIGFPGDLHRLNSHDYSMIRTKMKKIIRR